ncbi:MAG: aerial mycelium formation protein [Acidimicrobiia bacterium]
MSNRPRRRADRIFEPDYLESLKSVTTDELRKSREECEQLEAELSYTRRLLQGKLDILHHELERLADGGKSDIKGLIEKLPSILADGQPGGFGRHVRVLLPRNAEKQRREVERLASSANLARLDELSSEEIEEIVERVSEAEGKVSTERRQVQDVMDAIRAEMVRRYREGQEDPSALLSS